MTDNEPVINGRPIREGLVVVDESDSKSIRLLGSRCEDCNEVSIGTNAICLNCGGDNIASLKLQTEGKLWTYTIVRHKPPGGYLGPEPFEPFALGLVELADGVRIMAPLEGDPRSLRIGASVQLRSWDLHSDDGQYFRAFRFAPVRG